MLALLAGVAAVVVATRWWPRRRDGLGRSRPFPYLGVGALVVVAVALAVPGYLRHREEDRLSAVASTLVGVPVKVHCQTASAAFVDLGSELGYVKWGPDGRPEHQTLLKHAPCRELHDYLSSSKLHPSDDEVVAVHVLTHESMHMRGVMPEAQAECAAVQRDAETARLLGANNDDAVALARRYWLLVYPHMPDGYQSDACVRGGGLDEHLPDAPWG